MEAPGGAHSISCGSKRSLVSFREMRVLDNQCPLSRLLRTDQQRNGAYGALFSSSAF
jgi:hypothetical protein